MLELESQPFAKLKKVFLPTQNAKQKNTTFNFPQPHPTAPNPTRHKYIYIFAVLCFTNSIAQINTEKPSATSLSQMRQENQAKTQEQNRQQMQQFGIEPPPTPEQIAKGNYYDQLAVKRELKQREFFAELKSFDIPSKPLTPKELEEKEKTQKKLRLADTNSIEYKTYKVCYQKSYNEIVNMLNGKTPMSLKRAVFLTENPFYKNKLSYEKYCKQINDLVFICKQIMAENNLSPKNYMACHFAIQKLYAEKITYKNSLGKTETFEPLTYNLSIYDKERDDEDWTEQFVNKLLNIKMGQCHSMPLLYLILAEELNASAFLALSANHSYIKFGNQKQSYCFETTNGNFTSDEWIVTSGYVSATAIKNQIYLTPLVKKQVIAECIADLEGGLEFHCGKSDFSIKCANTTLHYFPNSIKSILIINNFIIAQCAKTAEKYHFPKYDNYYKFPELKKQYDEMINYELQVEETGYQKIPNEQYEKWRQSANEEKQRREHLTLISKLKESANEK